MEESTTATKTEPRRSRSIAGSIPRLTIGRLNNNELVFFDEERRESWIIYPPRTGYDFVRRPTRDTTVVEHRRWEPFTRPTEHCVRAREACLDHGLACNTHQAIQAALDVGWDPFR